MNDLDIRARSGHLTLALTIPHIAGHRPLDIDRINEDLHEVLHQFSANVQRAKLVHDLKILEAALYALATGDTIAGARTNLDLSDDARDAAVNLATAYLRSHGWRPAGDLLDLANGDVVVNLTDGRTLVNVRDLENGDEHLETPEGDHWVPDPNGQWWTVDNVLTIANASGQSFEEVQRTRTVPLIPGLPIILDQL